jgi:hypothetical protein
MADGTQLIQPGDRIKISSGQYPNAVKSGPFSTGSMIVEWVEIKDGIKEIWVHRDDTPTST